MKGAGKKVKPAIAGGKPIREEFLSFYCPAVGDDDVEAVSAALRSGWLTLGPRTEAFERELAAYLGAKHVIAVSSCSEAMFLALKALGVGPGDEVITSALTFASTVHAIIHTGAMPVLADIEDETFGPSPEEFEKKLTKKTRAFLPVHYGGQACMIDSIMSMARREGIPVVEDAAHGFGAAWRDKKVGTFGNAAAFSFYATKNITTGEGGCIATDDNDLAEMLRKLGFHGVSRDAWSRYADHGTWYYQVDLAGFKSNMSDILSSLGLSQLRKIDHLLSRKNEIAAHFLEELEELPTFQLPSTREENFNTWHLFVLRLNLDTLKIDRDFFIKALSAENIGTSVHFIPVYMHPFFKAYLKESYRFTKCDDFFTRCISLPIYAGMTERDEKDVINALNKIAAWYAR